MNVTRWVIIQIAIPTHPETIEIYQSLPRNHLQSIREGMLVISLNNTTTRRVSSESKREIPPLIVVTIFESHFRESIMI